MAFPAFFAHAAVHAGSQAAHPILNVVQQAGNAALPMDAPGVGEILDAGRKGYLDADAVQKLCLVNGVPIDIAGTGPAASAGVWNPTLAGWWTALYFAGQELPTPEQAFILTNRGVYQPEELDLNLHQHGFLDQSVRDDVSQLRYEVPGPSDLVRFAVRHIFEPDLIKELGYSDERDKGPYLLDIYHQAAGINYPIFTGPLAPTVKMVTGKDPATFVEFYASYDLPEPTWADAYWWSHWVLPSPSQAYEMYFRLRPDRDHKFDPPEAQGINFPYRNLDLLLRANDYPPTFRPMLAAIARPIPGIRFIRQLRAYNVYSYADVLELFKRMGYADRDATDLANAVEKNDQDQKSKGVGKEAIKEVIDYVRNGMLTDDAAAALLKSFGVPDDQVDKVIRLAHVQDAVARVKEFVRTVKSDFVKGKLSRDEARNALLGFGLIASWVEAELDVWDYTIRGNRRELTGLQNVQYACRGLLTADQLTQRLTNLGYSADDVRVLVGEASICAAARQAQAVAKAQAAADKAARALKQQQRDAAQVIAQARRQLASHGTPAQLRKWFCEGHLGSGELYDRLRQLGWPDPDIARLVGDCKSSGSTSSGGGATPTRSGAGRPSG